MPAINQGGFLSPVPNWFVEGWNKSEYLNLTNLILQNVSSVHKCKSINALTLRQDINPQTLVIVLYFSFMEFIQQNFCLSSSWLYIQIKCFVYLSLVIPLSALMCFHLLSLPLVVPQYLCLQANQLIFLCKSDTVNITLKIIFLVSTAPPVLGSTHLALWSFMRHVMSIYLLSDLQLSPGWFMYVIGLINPSLDCVWLLHCMWSASTFLLSLSLHYNF